MIQQLLAPLLGPVVDKALDLIPNKNERARAKEKLEGDLMAMVAQADTQQAEINKVEAGHKSLFVAGWRPFIGWTCGVAIAYAYVGQPFLAWGLVLADIPAEELPIIETDRLFQLVLGMLGMGGLRTFEKIKGVSREHKLSQ